MRAVPPYTSGKTLAALPAKMARGLGAVMIADARLHWCTRMLVSDLLRIDQGFGRLALRPVKTSEQFRIAMSLFNAWGSQIKPSISLSSLKKKITDCEDERNALAHGVWRKYSDGIRLIRAKGKSKEYPEKPNPEWDNLEYLFLPKSELLANDHFRNWVKKSREACRLIEKLRKEVNAALKAWPPINPEQPPFPPGLGVEVLQKVA